MVLETSRDLQHKSIKVDPANEQEISNSYPAPIIESLPNLCSASSGYLPSPSSSPSSSSSSTSSTSSSSSTSPTPSLSSAPTSVASSQISLPLSPQQAAPVSSKLDMCQSSQLNPSVFHKDHPMFGVSAEEDAEFKRSLCSDDNDDSSARLDDNQSQSQSQQRQQQQEERYQQPDMNDDDDDDDDDNDDDDDDVSNKVETNKEESQMNVDKSAAKETSTINQEQVVINKSENNQAEEQTVELRLLVRRREAGALIGKRGSNIKRLRESFKSSMFNIPDTGNGPERVVCITSNETSFNAILEDLTQLLMEKSPENDEQIELKLLIHSSHAGSIIGIGGQSIKKLRNDSKAAIKIYEMCCPLSNERVCAIKAKPPVVVSTIKLIQTILNENPIKGTIKPYDALHFDLNLVEKYGGYLPDDAQSVDMMITNHHHAHPHHHHYDQTLVGFNARHHAHDNYPVAKHYSIWRSSEFQNACEMMYEDPRKLGHHAPPISDAAPCSIDHHHHHHNQMANNPVLDMRSKGSSASFHLDNTHNGRGSQDCEEQKGTSIHAPHINCGVPRSVRFHPYASPQQTMAARGQLDYATSSFNSSGPQTISASLRQHQQQSTSNLNSNIYPAPSRLHYQHQSNANTNQMGQQHSRNQYMRTSGVYQPNNITERCRHLSPCLCMLLPMNHHPDILSSTGPLFQLVKNLNHHPRNVGGFNGTYSGNHNINNSNSSNGTNNANNNNNTDGGNINNNVNTNNKRKC